MNPTHIIETLGLIGLFAIIFAESGLFFGFFLPGDTLLFTAGLLASQHIISLPLLVVGASVCAILGDSVGYMFGKHIWPKIFTKDNSFFWNKEHITRSQKFFDRYGKRAILLARFMPIIRTFTPILAGVGSMEYQTFLRYNIGGGILWVTTLTVFGYLFGSLIPNPDTYIYPVIVGILLLSVLPVLKEFISSRNN